MRPKTRSRHLDRRIAELAERQHGVLARRQLLAAGACDRAVLSHISAARLWGLPIWPATPVHVTTPQQRCSSAKIAFHRSLIPGDELNEIDDVPVTTTARTLLDLASCVPPHRLRAIVDEAEYRQLTDIVRFFPVLVDRYPGRRGLTAIRRVLEEGVSCENRTREELEARFREFLIERDIPRPIFNRPMTVGSRRMVADCVWLRERLIVELDGGAAHRRRRNFDSDRARDRALLVAGWRPVRVTWRHLADDPDGLERELRTLLETAVSDG
jgi:very-short-patch-repair endonuclease